MRVRDCMTAPVQVIGPDAPGWEALGLMRRHRIRRLPVMEDGALVGIITYTDVMRMQPPVVGGAQRVLTLSIGILVRHLMTPSPLAVDPDEPLETAAMMMRQHKIGGLPVVEAGRLVGVITESDLFDVFAEMFKAGTDEARLRVAVGSVSVELPRIVAALARAGVPVLSLHTMRTRDAEGISLVVHERDRRRARDVVERLALEITFERSPVDTATGYGGRADA
jgi:acetoin utilization protein AcuB